ncbi:FAD-dependent oxidoreductase [Actinomadura luteofluorescens]|uniref:FAD-dependent oxidoreductase n=1 Tax=Actinomadura luteofluorescens TaxID=46163 RepID=UPI00362D1315
MNDETGRPEPAASRNASTGASSCCGVSACCTDAEQSVNPDVTVQQAKTDAGCGCVEAGTPDGLPVVVIGAGPVGLAAAAHLAERDQDFLVLEAGEKWARRSRSGGTSGCSRPGGTTPTPPPDGCWSPPGGVCPTPRRCRPAPNSSATTWLRSRGCPRWPTGSAPAPVWRR